MKNMSDGSILKKVSGNYKSVESNGGWKGCLETFIIDYVCSNISNQLTTAVRFVYVEGGAPALKAFSGTCGVSCVTAYEANSEPESSFMREIL